MRISIRVCGNVQAPKSIRIAREIRERVYVQTTKWNNPYQITNTRRPRPIQGNHETP